MRMKKRGSLLLALILLLAMFAPAQASTSRAANTRGNSTGNSIAYGMAAEENGKTFYVVQGKESVSGIYMTATTAAKGKLIYKGSDLSELNAINGWLYFSDGNGYWRVKQDGTGAKKLTDDRVNYVNVVGSLIYYKCMSSGADFGKLVRMKNNGTARKVLVNDEVGAVNAYEKTIYYMNLSDGQKPYSVSIDGKNRKKLSDKAMFRPCFAENGLVYYTDWSTGTLYRAKYDGSGATKLFSGGEAYYPNYRNGYVYFSAGGFSYRIKDGTTKAEKLTIAGASEFDIPAVLSGSIFRVALDAAYPKTLSYNIKTKKTETVPTQPAAGTATVDSLVCAITMTTPFNPWGQAGSPYVSGGSATVKVTGTKAGLVELKYGFGTADRSHSMLVKKGQSYTVTIPINSGSSSASGVGAFTVSIGSSSKSAGRYPYGTIYFGEITVK